MNKELSIDMLAAVKKPARYTGGEFGSIFKEEAEVRIALAFPDVYEVGMSYLGFKILYTWSIKWKALRQNGLMLPGSTWSS